MARIPLVMLLALAIAGCGGDLAKQNADLKAKNEQLATKLVAAEAENLRLKRQIELLTQTTDDLTRVKETKEAAKTK